MVAPTSPPRPLSTWSATSPGRAPVAGRQDLLRGVRLSRGAVRRPPSTPGGSRKRHRVDRSLHLRWEDRRVDTGGHRRWASAPAGPATARVADGDSSTARAPSGGRSALMPIDVETKPGMRRLLVAVGRLGGTRTACNIATGVHGSRWAPRSAKSLTPAARGCKVVTVDLNVPSCERHRVPRVATRRSTAAPQIRRPDPGPGAAGGGFLPPQPMSTTSASPGLAGHIPGMAAAQGRPDESPGSG